MKHRTLLEGSSVLVIKQTRALEVPVTDQIH